MISVTVLYNINITTKTNPRTRFGAPNVSRISMYDHVLCKSDDSVLGVLLIGYRLVGHIFCTTNCFITLTLLAFATLSLNQSDLS